MRRTADGVVFGVAIGCLAWLLAGAPSREVVPLLGGARLALPHGGVGRRTE